MREPLQCLHAEDRAHVLPGGCPLCRGELPAGRVPDDLLPFAAAAAAPFLLAIPLRRFVAGSTVGEKVRPRLAEHAGVLIGVLLVLVEQLAVGRVVLGRLYPFARDHAGQSNADAGSAVEPSGARRTRELLAEI